MRFADIIGHGDVKKALTTMCDSGRIAHAMMFYENEGCGALALALAYAQYLNCEDRKDGDSCGACPSCRKMEHLVHPDVHFVFPVNTGSKADASKKPTSSSYLEYWRPLVSGNPYFTESELYSALGIEGKSGMIAVAEAKYILETLSLATVGDGYRVIIVWLPEKMNAETANRLLKAIEEPPEKTVFLFVTHNPDKVLQTIMSRCQSIRVSPLSQEEVAEALVGQFGKDRHLSESRAALCGGSIGVALRELGDREEYEGFMSIFRNLMNGIVSRDLTPVLEASEQISAMESREKQKAFCIFAGECLRKIFLFQHDMARAAHADEEEAAFFSSVAAKCGPEFCARSSRLVDESVMLLERNVNAKIVFCDLADKMFLSI